MGMDGEAETAGSLAAMVGEVATELDSLMWGRIVNDCDGGDIGLRLGLGG